MIKRLALWMGLCGLAVTISGCRTTSPVGPGEASSVESGQKSRLTASVGETVTIEIPGNRTTGYVWTLAHPLDASVAKLVSSEYRVPSPDTARPAVGVGGVELFTFEAVGQGEARLRFEYRRPWEKDQPPAERREYVLTVK